MVDTAAPVVTILAPANGGATDSTTPTYSGGAGALTASSTTGADLAAITVKIYAGATATGTAVQTLTATASGGTWSVTSVTALTANATYTAEASQSDAAGNTGVSSANTFVMDTTAPLVTLTAPANTSGTNDSTPNFTGAAGILAASSTRSADLPAITVRIYAGPTVNGTPLQTLATTASGSTWSATSATALATNATYTAQASQSDTASATSGSPPQQHVRGSIPPLPSSP